ncbi:MAG: thioredoxin [Promethearchaeota archaeon CR_4]|nr:MAG: thioredoxin [Candidatus Lokiarchaeota archaeon CR_4]
MTATLDDKVEWIKQRKYLEMLHKQVQPNEGLSAMSIPRGTIHMGSCEAFSQIFNKYPETPIFIYLHAEWCAPCHTVGPIFDKLTQKYAGQVFFLDADVDQCKDIMTRFQVMGVPSFLVFHRWTEKYRLTGAQTFSSLDALVQKALALMPVRS